MGGAGGDGMGELLQAVCVHSVSYQKLLQKGYVL